MWVILVTFKWLVINKIQHPETDILVLLKINIICREYTKRIMWNKINFSK